MAGVTGDLNATPSSWHGNPNRPVEEVSWNDIQVFLSRLNQQQAEHLPGGWTYVFYPQKLSGSMLVVLAQPLPTSGGMELTLLVLIIIGMVPTIQGSDFSQTRDVGQYSANPWGFFDMSGNAYEWTNNWDNQYSGGHLIDPEGPAEGSQKSHSWWLMGE